MEPVSACEVAKSDKSSSIIELYMDDFGVNRDFACLLCPFLARIRLPALELPAMAQQVANRMLEDHLRVVSRTPAHRE
jgi:hypothetical protein